MTKYCGLSSLHPFSICWRNMHSRCYNPNNNRYKTYGARGITVCSEWHDFANFYDSMFPSWKTGLQLDRIDNNGPYDASNCQWISRLENTRKRTSSKLTEEQAREIQKLFKPGLAHQKRLAAQYKISDRMVRYIGSGDWWK